MNSSAQKGHFGIKHCEWFRYIYLTILTWVVVVLTHYATEHLFIYKLFTVGCKIIRSETGLFGLWLHFITILTLSTYPTYKINDVCTWPHHFPLCLHTVCVCLHRNVTKILANMMPDSLAGVLHQRKTWVQPLSIFEKTIYLLFFRIFEFFHIPMSVY